jgi:hypothetical protein
LVAIFFEGALMPSGGDLYILRTVLHNWDDRHAACILANCARAAAPSSVLLVMEALLPERADASVAFTLDMTALVAFGGRERTRGEYDQLLTQAGFRLEHVTPATANALPWSVMVSRRSARGKRFTRSRSASVNRRTGTLCPRPA